MTAELEENILDPFYKVDKTNLITLQTHFQVILGPEPKFNEEFHSFTLDGFDSVKILKDIIRNAAAVLAASEVQGTSYENDKELNDVWDKRTTELINQFKQAP